MAATAILAAGLVSSASAVNRIKSFQYVAHFVCGANPQALPRVLPGQYATTVVIHNPGSRTASASATAALTFPPGGVTLPQADIVLDEGEVTSIDCATLMLDAGPPYTAGVVIITSNRRLDVRRIQTAGPGGEGGSSVATVDVDSVPERRL